ncbi:hypothetical protein [Roseateles asaccharophilus]|uniref:DNA-directed RNA polymerase specialized sigma24 family protein n=1 Tax=Roseateles asaccharophilus TaxID=582607 RepID=A0ABU2A3Q9_9BURK|nr:hypothetical protein [Roseateles asaccharophilus]MDR7331750.1 DNA-directed RNA polymerase specialized sigma24 family protein [Roseateles asaccharophilus]
MAKIQQIDDMLRRWAAAVAGEGDGSGYPTMSVLHQDWSPPSPGQTPTMKTVSRGRDVDRVHAAVAALSMRERNTVVVHYCSGSLSLAEQAAKLGCQVRTVEKRIEAIHRVLAASLLGE